MLSFPPSVRKRNVRLVLLQCAKSILKYVYPVLFLFVVESCLLMLSVGLDNFFANLLDCFNLPRFLKFVGAQAIFMWFRYIFLRLFSCLILSPLL